ncbi:MAG: SHOCT domain-containing protein [Actinomycetota bacterium]
MSPDRPPLRRTITAILVIATLVGFVSVFAVWAKRQLLESSTYAETSTKLLEDEDIRDALAAFLVDELYANVDVEAQLKKALPPRADVLAGPAAGALRQLAARVAEEALQRPRVQLLWRQANEQAHAALLNLIQGGGTVVSTESGDVTLDLGTLVTQIGSQAGVDVAGKIPPDVGQLEVVSSDEITFAQDLLNLLQKLALALPLAALALYALAISLAKGRRRETLRTVGFCFIGIGVAVIVGRSLAGNYVVGALTTTAAVEPAASSAWDILTSLLEGIGSAMIGYGVVIVLGAWLAGPGHAAVELRRGMTPALRPRRIAYAVLAVIMLLVFWWAPTQGTERLIPSLILIALAIAGLEALRLQALRDFPNETWQPGGVRAAFAGARDRRRRQPTAGVPPEERRLEGLERLTKLREAGALDADEFEREKRRILGSA